MEYYDQFRHWFWDPTFWLPPNVTWKDIARKGVANEPYYPDFYDLGVAFPLAVLLFFVRLLWERFIAYPIGRYCNVRETPPSPAASNDVLEKAYRQYGKVPPKHSVLVGLSKQADLTTRQIERWWRRRRLQGKHSEMQRFQETSWRFLFYFTAFWGGLYALWDKPWLWDTKHCWYNFPFQHIPTEIWWYYMLELGFYWSLVLSLFMDVKRKDFREMMVHHFATITLIVMSWSDNMVRIGTLVLCVHDAVDYFLEGGKLANYCKFPKIRDTLFVMFSVVWVLTRMTYFPFWIIYSTLFEGHVIIGAFTNIYYYYNGFLGTLQVLHIIWFYMILKMVYKYVVKGELDKDDRSDTEIETNSEDDMTNTTTKTDSSNKHDSRSNGKQRNVTDSMSHTCNNNSLQAEKVTSS